MATEMAKMALFRQSVDRMGWHEGEKNEVAFNVSMTLSPGTEHRGGSVHAVPLALDCAKNLQPDTSATPPVHGHG